MRGLSEGWGAVLGSPPSVGVVGSLESESVSPSRSELKGVLGSVLCSSDPSG